jgi:hypothetical protein
MSRKIGVRTNERAKATHPSQINEFILLPQITHLYAPEYDPEYSPIPPATPNYKGFDPSTPMSTCLQNDENVCDKTQMYYRLNNPNH